MLEAYFDDSGLDQGPALVLAGFLSTAERWATFKEDWQDALSCLDERKKGGPKRLKMSRAMSARERGPEKCALWDARLARFQTIIEKHAIMGFGCVVKRGAFRELFCNDDVAILDHAYHIAFIGVIAATIRCFQKLGIDDKVDFVFDRQMAHFGKSNAALLEVWRNNPELARCVGRPPSWADDDQVLPLQAAEWLVWQLRKCFSSDKDEHMENNPLFIARDGVSAPFVRTLPIIVDVWDRERFRIIRNDFRSSQMAAFDELPEDIRNFVLEKRKDS